MPLGECSAAMGFQVKEIKRQSRAVKVTHPPAERRQLHKRMKWAASQVQWSDSVMKRLHKQGFLEFMKMWRKPSVLSEERLMPREEKPCGFVHHFCRRQKWWAFRDSNPRHSRCKRDALTNWANRPNDKKNRDFLLSVMKKSSKFLLRYIIFFVFQVEKLKK